jgi:hypothetical protein
MFGHARIPLLERKSTGPAQGAAPGSECVEIGKTLRFGRAVLIFALDMDGYPVSTRTRPSRSGFSLGMGDGSVVDLLVARSMSSLSPVLLKNRNQKFHSAGKKVSPAGVTTPSSACRDPMDSSTY